MSSSSSFPERRVSRPRWLTLVAALILILALATSSIYADAAPTDYDGDDLSDFVNGVLHPFAARNVQDLLRDGTELTTTTTEDPSGLLTTTTEDPNEPMETTTTTVDPDKPYLSTPPSGGYPPDSQTYTRRPAKEVKQAFFIKCWYVAIIILVVGVAVLYILLCVWICCHFDRSEQSRAKKVVQASYEQNGYYQLENGSRSGSSNSLSSNSASGSSAPRGGSTYEMNMSSAMMYRDADDVSVSTTNPLNGDDYYA